MKFFVKDFFSKCDQIHSFIRIWLRLLKRLLNEKFNFCVVLAKDLTDATLIYLTVHDTHFVNRQKDPQELFCKKCCSQKLRNIHRKIPFLESLFDKVADLFKCTFFEEH